jgi:hypothetical protein
MFQRERALALDARAHHSPWEKDTYLQQAFKTPTASKGWERQVLLFHHREYNRKEVLNEVLTDLGETGPLS